MVTKWYYSTSHTDIIYYIDWHISQHAKKIITTNRQKTLLYILIFSENNYNYNFINIYIYMYIV